MVSIQLTNWAGNFTFEARQLHHPSSLEELRRLVGGAERIRPLGTAHSFSRVADTSDDLVSVAGLPHTVEVNADRSTVTVAAAVRYGELAARLHAEGYALHNLGSLPHISVAGACATATHGSGDANGNLSTAVAAMEIVNADGDVVVVGRDDDEFTGMVVGLGALGVVTSLELDVQPTFDIQQCIYQNVPLEQVAEHLDDIFSSAYSVSLFTDWRGPRINQVWRKRRVDGPDLWQPEPEWMGAVLADGPVHPVPGMPADHCTEQLGVPGAWHERLPHFRLEFTPSSGEELQSEYLVPRDRAVEALDAVYELRDRVAPVLQISEIRTVAADDLWLSPSYRRESVAIHFTWVKDLPAVAPVMAAIEERLSPFEARPHWGKLSGISPEVVSGRYDRRSDFRRLLRHHDPTGKFRNDLIDSYFPTD